MSDHDSELPDGAVMLGCVDNSSIEGMKLSFWQGSAGPVAMLEDTYPYETPRQDARQVIRIQPDDQLKITRLGKLAKQFIALETRVECHRSGVLLWRADFDMNSHWGGISDEDVIRTITEMCLKLALKIEVSEMLYEDLRQSSSESADL